MKETLTTQRVADRLNADDSAGWTYAGAYALAEYLTQQEEDLGKEMELDVVAIRCGYSRHDSLQDWAKDYFSDWKEDLGIDGGDEDSEGDDQETIDEKIKDYIDEKIKDYINDHGQLIEFSGGVIVSNF